MKNLQIGIIGSCSDLKYSKKAKTAAQQLGKSLAQRGYTLIYGAEKDIDSLPTIAAKSCRMFGGVTVGMTYEKGMSLYEDNAASIVVATGLVRGGGRETPLILSCDAVISISGGSGTLNEICVAYQANIPVIMLLGFGGWSDKLASSYLDERKRYEFITVKSPNEAIETVSRVVERSNG